MKIITKNKHAYHDYEILDTYEAGIVLTGDEVKSIRRGHASINDAFATVQQNELILINCNISAYSHAYVKGDFSRRSRKLLLHKKEINKLIGEISRKGLTLIPLKMYFNNKGFIKVEIGVAKHKKKIDKKRDIKERDLTREASREIRGKIH